jgi:hypothetical protein
MLAPKSSEHAWAVTYVGYYSITSVPWKWHSRALSGLSPAAILPIVMLILPCGDNGVDDIGGACEIYASVLCGSRLRGGTLGFPEAVGG